MTHATTLSQQHSVSLSLFLSASLLSAHPFPFHIKDVSAQEKVPVNKHISTTVVLISQHKTILSHSCSLCVLYHLYGIFILEMLLSPSQSPLIHLTWQPKALF